MLVSQWEKETGKVLWTWIPASGTSVASRQSSRKDNLSHSACSLPAADTLSNELLFQFSINKLLSYRLAIIYDVEQAVSVIYGLNFSDKQTSNAVSNFPDEYVVCRDESCCPSSYIVASLRKMDGYCTNGHEFAPAHGDAYSTSWSPGICLAATVMLYFPLRASINAVVRPATPALDSSQLRVFFFMKGEELYRYPTTTMFFFSDISMLFDR